VLISPVRCLWSSLIFFLFLFDKTLIHEGTYFNSFLSSDDFAYGEGDCEDLACDEPGLALENTDSYVFFATNILNPQVFFLRWSFGAWLCSG